MTAACVAADPVTFDELWSHRGRITRYVAALVRPGDSAEVDDIVQVTFLRAWRALPSLVAESEGAVLAWLFTIARNVVCEQYRRGPGRRRACEYSTAPDHAVWQTTVAAPAGDLADAVCVRVDHLRSLAAVTDEHRRAVALRVGEQLPWREVATRMQCGELKVRRLIAEALAEVST